MTTPFDDPRIEAAAARTRQAAQERAAAYGPPKAQPTPKTDKEKKEELRKQRERLQAAGQRRFAATWHPGLPPREGRPEALEDSLRHPGLSPQRDGFEALDDGSVPQLRLHDRAVATSISLRAVLRNSRDAGRPDQPGREKRAGQPSPQDEATAAALYGQMSFEDVPHDQDQEEVLLSRLAILERYARDAAERAAAAPKTENPKSAPDPGVQQPKPEYRPYRR